MKRIYWLTFFGLSILAMCNMMTLAVQHETADLILQGGKIVTMDEQKPAADALAVRNGLILAVGTEKEMAPFIGNATRVIDLKGELVIPGFIESHGHFAAMGRAKMQLDLTKVKNWDEVIAMVADAVKKTKPGEWILGRGWHQEKWNKVPNPNVEGLPIHDTLSAISPENPVLLPHASGHSLFANQKAMALAGVNETTPNPEGGEIVKDNTGKPIGIFKENAEYLIYNVMQEQQAKRTELEKKTEILKVLELADKTCLENGITTFEDAGVSFAAVDIYKELVQQGKLGVRLNVMLNEPNSALLQHIAEYRLIGLGDNHLTVRAIKRLIDGALGSHGAWLLEPYTSLPSSSGLNTESIASMKETAQIAVAHGFQFCTHAIGDRGNRETLDVYEDAFKNNPTKKDLRWRIEHAQHLNPQDVPRFSQLGVIAAMQGIHCTSDGPWVAKRLGETRAAETSYLWRKLIDSGATICNGTDVPVEDVNPIACFYASATRKMNDGNIFHGEQKMTRLEALRSYTINGAFASFQEGEKGSLIPGKLADITVLSQDMLTVPEENILKTTVLYTIVGGKVLYQK